MFGDIFVYHDLERVYRVRPASRNLGGDAAKHSNAQDSYHNKKLPGPKC